MLKVFLTGGRGFRTGPDDTAPFGTLRSTTAFAPEASVYSRSVGTERRRHGAENLELRGVSHLRTYSFSQ